MDTVYKHDIGSLITVRRASGASAQTSGAETVITGTTFDRAKVGVMPLSAVFATLFETTLGSGNTLALTTIFQDSADGVAFAAYGDQDVSVVGTGPSGGGAVSGQNAVEVDLSSARQYVRAIVTPVLNRGGTDTMTGRIVAVFGGEDRLPAAA